MIRALLLVVAPASTWEVIRLSPRSVPAILYSYILPVLFITSAFEAFGLVRWGERQGGMGVIKKFTSGEAVLFVAGQFILTLTALFLGALLVKAVGQTFHKRHTFAKVFSVVAYSLAPLFLLRLLDAPAFVPIWMPWSLGILLAMSALYTGLPMVLEPDPPQAFGLFLMSSFWLLMLTGLVRVVTAFYLRGKLGPLQDFVLDLSQRLPF
ncbi:MAG TPA: YIP1 family protein [Clostridia bacterium]|nr:YIP1 family protein [Clostridia bacterium]